MKIEKAELARKIEQLKSIVPSKTTIDALKGVLYKDGYLIASDTQLTVKAKIEGITDEAEGTESFIIPDKAFDLIRSLPMGEMELTAGDGLVKMQIGKIKNQFRTLPAEQFAYNRENMEVGAEASIQAEELKAVISHVVYAASSDGANQLMTGIYLECKDEKLNFVALDGRRIALDCIDYQGDFKIIVPKSAAEKLLKLDLTGNISIAHDANGALFASEGYEVYTRLIHGEWFPYEKMFLETRLHTSVDRKEFLNAINRVKLCGSAEDKRPAIFDMAADNIHIAYKSATTDYHEDIPALEILEDSLKIGFDPRLLIESLKSFECDRVFLHLNNKKQPIIIKADGGNMMALILPVNIL